MSPLSKKIVSIQAELDYDSALFTGRAGSLSDDSIFLETSPTDSSVDFKPGSLLEVRLKAPTGQTINLNGKIVWSYKTPPHCLTNSIVFKVSDSKDKYDNFLQRLRND